MASENTQHVANSFVRKVVGGSWGLSTEVPWPPQRTLSSVWRQWSQLGPSYWPLVRRAQGCCPVLYGTQGGPTRDDLEQTSPGLSWRNLSLAKRRLTRQRGGREDPPAALGPGRSLAAGSAKPWAPPLDNGSRPLVGRSSQRPPSRFSPRCPPVQAPPWLPAPASESRRPISPAALPGLAGTQGWGIRALTPQVARTDDPQVSSTHSLVLCVLSPSLLFWKEGTFPLCQVRSRCRGNVTPAGVGQRAAESWVGSQARSDLDHCPNASGASGDSHWK